MRRIAKVLARTIAVIIAIPILLSAVILLAANTAPGQRLIETLAPTLSNGMVRVEGLSGRFPDALAVRRLTVADAAGVWLTVNGAAVDWSPRHLLEGEVSINRLEAESVTVDRLPRASGDTGGVNLPFPRVALARLRVARLEIGPEVAGQPVTLAVRGAGEIVARDSGEAHLAMTALASRGGDPLDHYSAEMSMDSSRLHLTLNVAESPRGLIAGLAKLPDLGAIAVTASADGPLDALATKVALDAGPLHGNVDGRVDAVARGADVTFSVLAPAMQPRPGFGWSSIRLDGTVHGPLTAPSARAALSIDHLTAEAARIDTARAEITANATGEANIKASLDGLRVPGPSPELLASGPIALDGSIRLADDRLPFRFSLRHPLFAADGTGDTGRGEMRLSVPDLSPFAALAGVDLRGQTDLTITTVRSADAVDLAAKGSIGIADGPRPVPKLVGDAGTIDLAASLHGADVRLHRLALTGAGFTAGASGQFAGGVLSADWLLSLNELGSIRTGLAGTVDARGHAGGPLDALSLTGDLTGKLGVNGGRPQQVVAHVTAEGLPDAPAGHLSASGTLLDAPLELALDAERRGDSFHVVVDRANWKSLTAGGALDLKSGEKLPTGRLAFNMTRMADLAALIGRPIAGDARASIESSPNAMRITAVISGGAVPGAATVNKASLDATITDPEGQPVIDGSLNLDGLEAGGTRASARVTAKGPVTDPVLTLAANSADVHGQPARLEAAGDLDGAHEILRLTSSRGSWGKETIRLIAPVKIGFGPAISIDGLRLGVRQGEIAVSGRVANGMAGAQRGTDLHVSLKNLPADLIATVAPAYAADGTIAGEAALTGSLTRPRGTIRITASGLHPRDGPGRAMPPAASTLDATLDGTTARIDAKLNAGKSSLTLSGRAPLDLTGRLDLRAGGTIDLTMLNPLVAAQGRNVRGRLDVNLAIGGTPAAPMASGTVRLAGGDFQDANIGTHIASIAGDVQIDGHTLRIQRFDGKAGPGTVAISGTADLAGGPDLAFSLRASDARLLSTDLATALIDANLTLRGKVTGNPMLAGTVLVRSAEIRVPEKLPATIVVLPMRVPGAPPVKSPPPAAMPDVGLNLTLDAPDQIYIRGRGLDAELGGRVTFTGTSSVVLPEGALQLRRGTFSLAGQSLNLTEGTIDFAGGPLTNPRLKLVATSSSATLIATLTVSGNVRDPKIVLSSVPDLPQDEILSQLLFNSTRARLNPFQAVQIAAALASISGVGPSITDPLGRVRSTLGLDQLSVGSDPNGGPTLQAGRYLARGVRVGATQGTGGESQATVEIDIAKGLKLETMVGTGAASATPVPGGSTNGTGVGLTYEFEY